MAQNSAQTELYANQAKVLSEELNQSRNDQTALAKAIGEFSKGGDMIGAYIAAGGSPKGVSALKPFLPKPPEKAPAGYRYTAGGNQEIIPGGPADVAESARKESDKREQERLSLEKERVNVSLRAERAKETETAEKKKAQEDAAKALYDNGKLKAGIMLENIQRAKGLVEQGWTQGAGSTTFGWTPTAASLDAAYTNIAGNTALETIAEARKASPSGGSPFGQLNQKELEVAMGSKGVLNRQITEDDAKTNLARIEKLLLQAYPEFKEQFGTSPTKPTKAKGATPVPPGWAISQ
jgi:hypothetical protein